MLTIAIGEMSEMRVRTLYKLFVYKVSSVKKNRWVFTSLDGHYSDNPKYVSEKVHVLYPEIEICWLVKKEYLHLVPSYYHVFDIDSKAAEHIRNTAEVVVDNVYGGKTYTQYDRTLSSLTKALFFEVLGHKKTQRVYTTWHGMPFKGCNDDQRGINFIANGVVMFTNSKFQSEVMSFITFRKIPMVCLGMPRLDTLFRTELDIEKLKNKLHLPSDKKVVLYAPTFRNDGKNTEEKNVCRSGINQLGEIKFDELFEALKGKFGGEWVFVCRFHYHVQSMVDWDNLNKKYPGKVINGNEYDDMMEYLACTDVLITDASSCMHDFSITKRPCFLFFPDYEQYISKERGEPFTPIDDLPYSLARYFDELLTQIDSFDHIEYRRKIEELHRGWETVDDGHSSERVSKYIYEHSNMLKKSQ